MAAALILVLAVVLSVVNAWLIMVVWGALALTFGFVTIGFGTAFLVSIALGLVRGDALRSVNTAKK
jgi:hypothetical protein